MHSLLRMPLPIRVILACGALALSGGGFVCAGNEPAPALEFRGMLTESGHQLFSLYDPATGRSTWLQLNEQLAGHRLVSFDSRQLVLHLKVGEQRVALPLIRGRARADAPAIVPVPAQRAVPADESGDQTFEIARLEREQSDLLELKAARENFGKVAASAAEVKR